MVVCRGKEERDMSEKIRFNNKEIDIAVKALRDSLAMLEGRANRLCYLVEIGMKDVELELNKCKFCGAENRESANFCTACGFQLRNYTSRHPSFPEKQAKALLDLTLKPLTAEINRKLSEGVSGESPCCGKNLE